jgi:hypothetical protein
MGGIIQPDGPQVGGLFFDGRVLLNRYPPTCMTVELQAVVVQLEIIELNCCYSYSYAAFNFLTDSVLNFCNFDESISLQDFLAAAVSHCLQAIC